HRLLGPHGHLRAAGPERSDPGDDPCAEADDRNQEGGARGGDAVPPRVRRRARDGRPHHAARDQQGHVRRMSLFASVHDAPAPDVAVEIAANRVSAAVLDRRGGEAVISAHAVEPLPPGALTPSLTTINTQNRTQVATALARVL